MNFLQATPLFPMFRVSRNWRNSASFFLRRCAALRRRFCAEFSAHSAPPTPRTRPLPRGPIQARCRMHIFSRARFSLPVAASNRSSTRAFAPAPSAPTASRSIPPGSVGCSAPPMKPPSCRPSPEFPGWKCAPTWSQHCCATQIPSAWRVRWKFASRCSIRLWWNLSAPCPTPRAAVAARKKLCSSNRSATFYRRKFSPSANAPSLCPGKNGCAARCVRASKPVSPPSPRDLPRISHSEGVRAVWNDFLAKKTSWSRPWSLYVLNEWCRRQLPA